jgi:hypothetical protein
LLWKGWRGVVFDQELVGTEQDLGGDTMVDRDACIVAQLLPARGSRFADEANPATERVDAICHTEQ